MPRSPVAWWTANRKANRLLQEGRGLYDAHELGAAEPLLRDALGAAQNGASPAVVAAAAEAYYSVLRRMKRYVEAVPIAEAWLSAQVRVGGRDTDEVRSVRNELTWINGKLGHFAEAERVTRERLASARRRGGEAERETGFALVTLGWALLNQTRVDEAEDVYREALAHLEKVAGVDDGVNGWALLGLAAIGVCRGDVAEAETQLIRAYDNWDRVGRTDMADRTREKLLDLYVEHADFTKAVAMVDKAMRNPHWQGRRNSERKARNLDRYAKALRGAGRDDEARRLETRASYLRAAIEQERADTAASRERLTADGAEQPGAIFEGEDEWPLATPVFVYK